MWKGWENEWRNRLSFGIGDNFLLLLLSPVTINESVIDEAMDTEATTESEWLFARLNGIGHNVNIPITLQAKNKGANFLT